MSDAQNEQVVARYTTIAGEQTIVTRHTNHAWTGFSGVHDCRWRCGCGEGCGEGRDVEEVVRDAAERHARDCRTPASTGKAVAALAAEDGVLARAVRELTAIRVEVTAMRTDAASMRQEIASLTTAVRDLTAAVTTAGEQVATEIRCLPETTGDVGAIAAAIDALAASHDRPRRGWPWRRQARDTGQTPETGQ